MTDKTGICQYPFLQEDLFPPTGGCKCSVYCGYNFKANNGTRIVVQGRYCDVVLNPGGMASCCVPCPIAPWKYGDGVAHGTRVASWISVGTLPLCIFLLLSYAILPAKYSHRHYMTICFTIGISLMQIAFVIPLAVDPDVCYNEITPKGMHDDLSCAFTGSFLLFGSWLVIIWSFIRAVAFHLQVCWEMVLGEWFMWGALICGWGIPAAGFTVMMVLTGTSFRFGQVCHININNSVHDFWIPILAISGAAIVFQLATMAYCIHIYIRTLVNQAPSTDSGGLPTYHSSTRHINARKAYRRIRKVFRLQWRGVAIVFIIIANALYFAIVFINLDSSTKNTQENFEKALPWLVCLSLTKADKEKCRSFSQGLGPNEVTLLAVLVLLALVGLWNFLLFARGSLFIGWAELLKNLLCCCFHRRRKEFVSVDARTLLPSSPDARTYEMLYNNNNNNSNNSPQQNYKSPEPMTQSPALDRASGSKSLEAQASFDDHGWDASDVGDMKRSLSQRQQQLLQRNPSAASTNFSIPRRPAPSATVWEGREWDPQATFAPGRDPK